MVVGNWAKKVKGLRGRDSYREVMVMSRAAQGKESLVM